MKPIVTIAAAALALSAAAEPFKVIVPLTPDDEGAMSYIVNYDNGDTIATVLAGEESAVFTGALDEPVLSRVLIEGKRFAPFILESGTISFNREGRAFGTMLNDQLRDFGTRVAALQQAFSAAASEEAQKDIYRRYEAMVDSMTVANADNDLGYYMFLNGDLSSMSVAEIDALLSRYPAFAERTRVKSMREKAERREATQPGRSFLDFEVTYDGKTERLSDYVGKGKYTLVDFWASWCGPCMRQLPVLKGLYERWHDKGLDVLGVAVWDEPADTRRAIAEHELPWPCIIDAQQIPTDIYGISGIPCIILFDPEGKIVSRDKQGDELVADVDAAMSAATR